MDNEQVARDQGAADARAVKPAKAWFFLGDLYVRDPNARAMGNPRIMARRLDVLDAETQEYRSAYAYAQAYEANRG